MVVAGTNKSNQRSESYSSSAAPFSGSASAKNYVTALGYFPRFENTFQVIPGRRYTAMVKMRASVGPVQLGVKWVTNPDSAPVISQSASNGNWTTVKASGIAPENAISMYVWMGVPDNTAIGTEFEIDQLMLVSKDYDGPFGTGDTYGWEWEGTPHASTSKGYPVGRAQLAGKPLWSGTTPGTYVLTSVVPSNPPLLTDLAPRTIYTIVDGLVDLPSGNIDVILLYGIDTLSDTVPNRFLTLRQQSETGTTTNSLLNRKTGGSGAITLGLPSSGRHVLISGMDERGRLFTTFDKNALVTDVDEVMSLPHERVTIANNTAYHQHVATFIYPGVHSSAVRQEMVKLLAHEYAIPGM
jgi:hypothetical protein